MEEFQAGTAKQGPHKVKPAEPEIRNRLSSFAPQGSKKLPVALGMLLIPEVLRLCRSAGKGCLPTLSCPWAAELPQTHGEA